MMQWIPAAVAIALFADARQIEGAEQPAAGVRFTTDVAPLLVSKCQGCHGPRRQEGGDRLDTFERLMRPGDSEAAPVTPGRPELSEILRLIASKDEDERMPQKDDPLAPEQVALIERWVREGAKFD